MNVTKRYSYIDYVDRFNESKSISVTLNVITKLENIIHSKEFNRRMVQRCVFIVTISGIFNKNQLFALKIVVRLFDQHRRKMYITNLQRVQY